MTQGFCLLEHSIASLFFFLPELEIKRNAVIIRNKIRAYDFSKGLTRAVLALTPKSPHSDGGICRRNRNVGVMSSGNPVARELFWSN